MDKLNTTYAFTIFNIKNYIVSSYFALYLFEFIVRVNWSKEWRDMERASVIGMLLPADKGTHSQQCETLR